MIKKNILSEILCFTPNQFMEIFSLAPRTRFHQFFKIRLAGEKYFQFL